MIDYRILTLWQPWASLLIHGIKKIETRPKPTKHIITPYDDQDEHSSKKVYLIHAAKKWDKKQRELCFTEPFWSMLTGLNQPTNDSCGFRFLTKETKLPSVPNGVFLPFGCIIGSIEVTECLKVHDCLFYASKLARRVNNHIDIIQVNSPEFYFGDYTIGRYAWLTQNPKVLKEPIPYKGQQGYYGKFKGNEEELIYV